MGIGNTLTFFSLQVSVQVYSLISQTEEERKTFFGGCKNGDHIMMLPSRALGCHKKEKVYPVVKFEIILPLLSCLLGPLRKRHCRAWGFMINLWIDSRTYQKYRMLLSARQMSKYMF